MARIKDTITHAIPWVEPILDYFDWRKQVIALVATLVIGVWSFVIELSWPAIIVLAFGMLVSAAYALTLPALIKLIHVGVEPTSKSFDLEVQEAVYVVPGRLFVGKSRT
jgi:sensor histidine kinase regulating citrate/malate metabolism